MYTCMKGAWANIKLIFFNMEVVSLRKWYLQTLLKYFKAFAQKPKTFFNNELIRV